MCVARGRCFITLVGKDDLEFMTVKLKGLTGGYRSKVMSEGREGVHRVYLPNAFGCLKTVKVYRCNTTRKKRGIRTTKMIRKYVL